MSFLQAPDLVVFATDTFGIRVDMEVPAFSTSNEFVPEVDENFLFQPEVTHAILASLVHNRKTLIQGFHGTGKSTHIEQVAARLNWPCLRVNLDSQITRIDLIGRDVITLENGKQVTAFHEGFLPFALQRPMILVLDEYDAGRPDVMFVIQRVLESQGKLTLLEQNRVISAHPFFRLFGTINTVGLGDASGLYRGTQIINQGQMDRWNLVATLDYLSPEAEVDIVLAKVPGYDDIDGRTIVAQMVAVANLTRIGFKLNDVSTVMSPRTVIYWAENVRILGDVRLAFRMTFLNRCDEVEMKIFEEYLQRCFGDDVNAGSP